MADTNFYQHLIRLRDNVRAVIDKQNSFESSIEDGAAYRRDI